MTSDVDIVERLTDAANAVPLVIKDGEVMKQTQAYLKDAIAELKRLRRQRDWFLSHVYVEDDGRGVGLPLGTSTIESGDKERSLKNLEQALQREQDND
jgi:hypothetical protein